MPEGPSILIATEEMSPAIGKKVSFVGGNTRQPVKQLKGQTLKDAGSWGKHLLLFFSKSVLKIHFLLWGSYSVNEKKPNRNIRLQLNIGKTKLYFYACAVSFLEDDPKKITTGVLMFFRQHGVKTPRLRNSLNNKTKWFVMS